MIRSSWQSELGELRGDVLAPCQQNRVRNSLIDENLRGAQDLVLFAFGKDDPLGIRLGSRGHSAHQFEAPRDQMLEPVAVVLERADRDAGDPALLRRHRDRRSHCQEHPVVERLGNEVVAAELERLEPVGLEHGVRHVFARQLRERSRCRKLHGVVDVGRSRVQRPAEEEGKAEDVVHLVGIVAAARGDDGIRARRDCLVVADLRRRIGHGEDDRTRSHREQHFRSDCAGDREADQHVGSDQGVGERPRGGFGGELHLLGVGVVRSPAIDHPLAVAKQHVLLADPELEVEPQATEGRSPGSGDHELHVLETLAGDFERR